MKNALIILLAIVSLLLYSCLAKAQILTATAVKMLYEQNARSRDDLAQYEALNAKYEQYNSFVGALAAVDHAYDRATDNCFDHSVALQQELRKRGIESSILINENRNHAWLGVWIEATDGTFINPTKNNLHPIELRSDRNTVIMADPIKARVGVSTTEPFPVLWWK